MMGQKYFKGEQTYVWVGAKSAKYNKINGIQKTSELGKIVARGVAL